MQNCNAAFGMNQLQIETEMRTDMKNKELLENVKHFTKARPFSIHKTEIGADSTNALYVHYHPEMEFIYLDEGSMTFYVEGKQYNMKEGDALFITRTG